MEKIRIKELIEFKRKSSDKSRKNFALKLKTRKITEKKKEDKNSGGNYWAESVSCIHNVFKHNDYKFYDEKIEEVATKIPFTEIVKTKNRLLQNLKILTSFKEFDLLDLRPSQELHFETIHKASKIIDSHGLPLYLNPNLIFSFEDNGKKQIGALFLIPQKDGFRKAELGVFTEVLYNYLVKNYAHDFQIATEYCIAIDTFDAKKVSYQDLLDGEIPFLLESILLDIKNL